MAHIGTVTAKTGTGTSISSLKLNNISKIHHDLIRQIVTVEFTDGKPNQEFDVSANNTFTLTYSAPNYTLTIS